MFVKTYRQTLKMGERSKGIETGSNSIIEYSMLCCHRQVVSTTLGPEMTALLARNRSQTDEAANATGVEFTFR